MQVLMGVRNMRKTVWYFCTFAVTDVDWRSVAAHVHWETIVAEIKPDDILPPASKLTSMLAWYKHRLSHIMPYQLIYKAAFTSDTCSRIRVSRSSNLYPDTSGYKWIQWCRRDDSFVADTRYRYTVDGDRRYKLMDTCIRATAYMYKV